MPNEKERPLITRNISLDMGTHQAIEAVRDDMTLPNYSAAVRQIVAEWKQLKKLAAQLQKVIP